MNTFKRLDNDSHPIAKTLGTLIGLFGNLFLWAVALYYAYGWISWNFNLPPMTYLEMVCMYTSFRAICSALGRIFHAE